jgi:predicted outer membrane repeat protein
MQLFSWLHERLTGRSHTRGTSARKSLPRFRPQLESLEGRVVPSTLTVTSNADNGASGTLRWAVAQAQAGDTIDIVTTQPILLTQGELKLGNVTIQGTAANPATISGNGTSRVFEASGAYITLNYLNITGGNGVAANPSGNAALDGLGGAILNDGYNLVLNYCKLTGDSANNGGAIYNSTGPYFSTTEVDAWNCTFSGNVAKSYGGAIYNLSGTVTVSGSTLSNNSASSGGALYNFSGTAAVNNSTLSVNSAVNQGGGIYIAGGNLLLSSTFSGNTATQGGGIYNANGSATIRSSTISGNSAMDGGGIYNKSGSVSIYAGTTFTGNSASDHGGGIYNANGTVILWRVNLALPKFSGNSPEDIFGTYSILTYHRPNSW